MASEKKYKKEILIIRHAERVDLVYGHDWFEKTFDKQGKYKRTDMNMPVALPKKRNPKNFLLDSPLTNIGLHQAYLVGENLGEVNYKIGKVFSSPAVRCIQTATNVLKAMNLQDKVKINVEPGDVYDKHFPIFMTHEELIESGFNINTEYKPVLSIEQLKIIRREKVGDWFKRSFEISSKVIQNESENDGNILIFAHGGSFDAITRLHVKVNKEPIVTDRAEFIPYVCVMRMGLSSDGKFDLIEPPTLTLKHSHNFQYNWKLFNS